MTDPTRRAAFLCPDCSTVNMVAAALPDHTEDGDGAVVAVVHDESCPWLDALPEDERVQVDDYGAVVHFRAGEVTRTW